MIRILNENTLNSLEKYREENNLSGPLLVSSDQEFITNINKNKSIMYIGQETNGWLNENDVIEYERLYKSFLYNNHHSRNFWTFIKIIINKYKKLDNVLWANALICGKKDEIGTPRINDKVLELSLIYLAELYKYFKPDMTVIVSGPNNPYYEVIKEFLKLIDSSLKDEKPSIKKTFLQDLNNNIFYTYHPNYLNRIHESDKISLELRRQFTKL